MSASPNEVNKEAAPAPTKVAKPEKKAPAAPVSTSPFKRRGAAALAGAAASILKTTKQRPMEQARSTLPHVSTGSIIVNNLIGGSPAADGKGPICPGFPSRRISEVYGPESSGKTTLLLSAMAQVQKEGGSAMFIDFEHALDHNYARSLGLKIPSDTFKVYAPSTMEEGLQMIARGILHGVDIIGVDSVAAMTPKTELEKGFDDPAKIGIMASILSGNLKKVVIWLENYPKVPGKDGEEKKKDETAPGTALVFLNQTRALINTGGGGHGDNETTPGGKALKFYSHLRLRLSRIKSEYVERMSRTSGKKERFPYGNVTDVKVVKSKIDAKQGQKGTIFIRYGYGIDEYLTVIETGVIHRFLKKDGSQYVFSGQKFRGKDALRQYLINNPTAYEELRQKVADAVMVSATAPSTIEDEDLAEGDEMDDEMGGSSEDEPVEELVEDEE